MIGAHPLGNDWDMTWAPIILTQPGARSKAALGGQVPCPKGLYPVVAVPACIHAGHNRTPNRTEGLTMERIVGTAGTSGSVRCTLDPLGPR